MEEIAIKYWSPHGRQEEKKFQKGDSRIDLVMRAAKRIDLSNMSKCNHLETLNISLNMLEELDLMPLSDCSSLTKLNIRNNHLTRLDMWPLLGCEKLTEIDLSENRLHGLDLSPVFFQSTVRMDSSVVLSADSLLRYVLTSDELKARFQLIRTDGAPWTAPPVIIWIEYAALARKLEWSKIKERIDSLLSKMADNDWFAVQRGLLGGFGMEELAGFDGNPQRLMKGTTNNLSYKEARHVVFDNAIDLLEEQLAKGKPTLFLDTDSMRRTRASKLIPAIAERRKQEIENVVLPIKGSKVFLEPLWSTYYGFQLLKALGLELTTNLESLHRIRESFEELGMDIHTQKISTTVPAIQSEISQSMLYHLLNCIQRKYD